MRAKTINEIVRGGSGLATLGVGHVTTMKAYNYAKANWPKYIENNEKTMDAVFSNKKFKYLSRMEDKFGISMNDYMWIKWKNNTNQEFDDWLTNIKFDKTLAINPNSWNSSDARVVKYSYVWGVGHLSISNDFFDTDSIRGYFFKYK